MGNRLATFVGVMCGAISIAAQCDVVRVAAGMPNLAVSRTPAFAQSAPQERQDHNSGAHLYREFCASCHGESGKGDGPLSDIARVRPSDLTSLTRHHGGVFPRARVLSYLDGTKPVAAHDRTAMPKWHDVLARLEGGDERAVRRRLDALVSHVESLQGKN
jgi:mono/diheme cytochrome c family protein